MKTLGASNKVFYYTAHDSSTFNIRFRLQFVEDFDLEVMKQCVSETLKLYPELAQQIVRKGSRFEAEHNTREMCFYKDETGRYEFGDRDTNGYMMYFRYGRDFLELNFFHGVTDASGAFEFIRCFLYKYCCKQGIELSDDEINALRESIRNSESDYESGDKEDLYTPYEKYCNKDSKPSKDYSGQDIFYIPAEEYPDEAEATNSWVMNLSVSEFLAKTKEYGVSAVPLLVDIIEGSLRKAYNAGDKAVVTMVPVNYRPFFGSDTKVNFSDGVQISYSKEDEALSHHDRCIKMKADMTSQINKENFEAIIASKISTVEMFENSEDPFNRPKGKRPFTVALSYPGKVDFTPGLNRFIKDFDIRLFVKTFSLIAYSYGDKLSFYISARTDDETFANTIANGFREFGFNVSFSHNGYIYPDKLKIESL